MGAGESTVSDVSSQRTTWRIGSASSPVVCSAVFQPFLHHLDLRARGDELTLGVRELVTHRLADVPSSYSGWLDHPLFRGGREIFRWEHVWVRVGAEVIDGNVDSLFENPMVPSASAVQP
jgi:hypothetical protein